MRIRRIELRGFKSFVDRTTLQLGPGISGVVGPNGCGKSNVIDAIKWTLGEQSPRTLRGSEMRDVIFAGATGCRPAASAEVTIAFDNSDGSFGGKYARFEEIEVGRRLFRDGGSDYLLNRAACRRKDIVELFEDTGVGARAYSIIEQGRVDFVVNARPEERRILIDEVAGINRFKRQRAEAERRMGRTRENLVRVADLMQEMGRHRRSLQAQASRARKYRELRAAWRAAALGALAGAGRVDRERLIEGTRKLEELAARETAATERLESATAEAAGLRERSSEARRLHEQLRDRRAEAAAARQLRVREGQLRKEELQGVRRQLERLQEETVELTRLQGRLRRAAVTAQAASAEARAGLEQSEAKLGSATRDEDAVRAAAREAHGRVEAAKAHQLEVMTDAARTQNMLTLLERRIAAGEEELLGQAERIEQERARDSELAAAVVEVEKRLADAGARRKELAAEVERFDVSLAEAKASHAQAESELRGAEAALRASTARLASLTELIDGLEGFGDGARKAAEVLGDAVLGTVADLLRPEREVEGLVELALGERLQGLVVRDADSAASRIAGDVEGRVLLVPAKAGAPADEDSLAGRVAAEVPGLSDRLLGDATEGPVPGSIRDRTGVRVGRVESGDGLLAQRRAARELQEQIEGLQACADALAGVCEEAASVTRTHSERRVELAAEGHEAELADLGCRRDLDDARGQRNRARKAVEQAGLERERLAARLQTSREELVRVAAEQDAHARAREELEQAIERDRAAAADAERRREEASAASTEARVLLAGAQQTAATTQRDARRALTDADDVERRQRRAVQDEQTAAARKQHLEQRLEDLAREEMELGVEYDTLAAEVEAAAVAREETGAAWRRVEEGLRELRGTADQLRRDVSSVQIAAAEARTALAGARARAAEQFDVDLDPVLASLVEQGRVEVAMKGGDPVTLEADALSVSGAVRALHEDAVRLAARLDALGPVNLAADAEFQEVDERYGELQTQREDLEKALADLRRAISKIEQDTKERFGVAFRAVTDRFSALYPRLVGGGRAELQLTTPKDLLGTGIDIVVEPPGKRLQNLSLLSGGEKAMAAIALVFAIFQVKPSPFCLLDEVDAPLDDSNSRRMGDMLKEMAAETQFVVITHNRTTMEIADVLYGVTMQRPGVSTVVSVRMD